MKRLPILSLLSVVLLAGAVSAAEPSLLSKAGPEEKQLYAQAKPLILAEAAKPPLILKDSVESYFWVMSARLAPLVRAHGYSKEPELLEAFVPLMKQVLSQRYIHPSKPEWSGWFHYKDRFGDAMIDHDTILYFVPVLRFVREVRADASLRSRYGELAEKWLKDVQASIRAWDRRGCWHELGDKGGWYSNPTHYPDPNTGELVRRTDIFAGGVIPYNKVHAFCEALSLAYRITGDEWYVQRMAKCAKRFRGNWRVDDKHAEWNYRDHAFAGDYVSGVVGQGKTRTGAFVHVKGGYYALDVEGVVCCYDVGAFYQRADIEKLIQTNLKFMWMGDEKDPKFRKINGTYKAEGKYNKGYLWTALAHFSPEVRRLWKTQLETQRKARRWMWWASTLDYLVETSQPVSWEPRYVKKAPAPPS